MKKEIANLKRPNTLRRTSTAFGAQFGKNKNHVEHNTINIIDTIAYTNRYRFYNAINELID